MCPTICRHPAPFWSLPDLGIAASRRRRCRIEAADSRRSLFRTNGNRETSSRPSRSLACSRRFDTTDPSRSSARRWTGESWPDIGTTWRQDEGKRVGSRMDRNVQCGIYSAPCDVVRRKPDSLVPGGNLRILPLRERTCAVASGAYISCNTTHNASRYADTAVELLAQIPAFYDLRSICFDRVVERSVG
jgi:hypothetical protein